MLNWLKIDCTLEKNSYKPSFFIGSLIRGVLGHSLKSVICINPIYKCDGCFAYSDCLYYKFYEEENVFHSFRLGITLQPNSLDFSIYLFEDATNSLPYILSAIKKAFEEIGITKNQILMRVKSIKVSNQEVYDGKDFLSLTKITLNNLEIDNFYKDVVLEFTMTLRLKEKNQLVRKIFQFQTLINNIHNRYQQLKGETRTKLGYKVHGEIVESTLKFVDMQRYSNRQKSKMQYGGLKGNIKIEGIDKQSFVYLKIGEIIGAGKQTVFGLGSYIIKGER